MPTKPENRNYAKEAARETPARQQDRRDRMNARYAYEKTHGDLPTSTQVDHIKSLGRGGTNSADNLRAISKKKNESFNRAGPGGKQIGKA